MANPEIQETGIDYFLPVFNPVISRVMLGTMAPSIIIFGGVLAFNKSTGMYCPTDSRDPNTANAKAIVLECIADFVPAGSRPLTALIGGEGPDDLVGFAYSGDNLDTIPAGAEDSYRVQLRKYGIYLRPFVKIDELDNPL